MLVNGKVSLLPVSSLKEVHLEFSDLQHETSRSLANHRTVGSLLLHCISALIALTLLLGELPLHDDQMCGFKVPRNFQEILAIKPHGHLPLSTLAFQDF